MKQKSMRASIAESGCSGEWCSGWCSLTQLPEAVADQKKKKRRL